MTVQKDQDHHLMNEERIEARKDDVKSFGYESADVRMTSFQVQDKRGVRFLLVSAFDFHIFFD
jgi:hypothetical protein